MSSEIALVVRRVIRAAPARVFAAWTEAEEIVRWWGPAPVTCTSAELDLRVGGTYRIGNQMPDGSVVWITGEFERVDPPRELVYTWCVEGGGRPASERSRVRVRFEPAGGDTEIVIVHERIESEAIRADHEQGWRGCLDGLERHFANG
jgi:uncharacterized protein YndB with AHSA1/START domain